VASGSGDLETSAGDAPDLIGQHAAVDRCQAQAAKPPAGEQDGDRQEKRASPMHKEGGNADGGGQHRERTGPFAGADGETESETERGDNEMRRGEPLERIHSSTSSFSSASRVGPIPGTASSSSTEEKAPCSLR
jgi:hypothetical protein